MPRPVTLLAAVLLAAEGDGPDGSVSGEVKIAWRPERGRPRGE